MSSSISENAEQEFTSHITTRSSAASSSGGANSERVSRYTFRANATRPERTTRKRTTRTSSSSEADDSNVSDSHESENSLDDISADPDFVIASRSSTTKRQRTTETFKKKSEINDSVYADSFNEHPNNIDAAEALIDETLHRSAFKTANRLLSIYTLLKMDFSKEPPKWIDREIYDTMLQMRDLGTLVTFRYDEKTRILDIIVPDAYDAIVHSRMTCGEKLSKASLIKPRRTWWFKGDLGPFVAVQNKALSWEKVIHLGLVPCVKSIRIPEELANLTTFKVCVAQASVFKDRMRLIRILDTFIWNIVGEYVGTEIRDLLMTGDPYMKDPRIKAQIPFYTAFRAGFYYTFNGSPGFRSNYTPQ